MNEVRKECKFAVHLPPPSPDQPDIHLVKEQWHYPDGTTEPNLRYIKDFKRPVFVTKPAYRTYQDKKEYELVDKLDRYDCLESEVQKVLRAALNAPPGSWLQELKSNPYVYGADVSSTSWIKHHYQTQYPDLQSAYTVASLDTETEEVRGTKTIILCTVMFKHQIVTAVVKSAVQGHAVPEQKIQEQFQRYLGEYIRLYGLELTVYVVERPYDAVAACFKHIHEWKPDFLSIWNMNFDIPKIIEACQAAGVPPKHLFSDPSVPKPYRFFKYKQGLMKKVTSSGKVNPIPPSAQWHVVQAPSSFFVVDAMCAYRILRLGSAEEPSYRLDAILQKELKLTKLKIPGTDQWKGLTWHEMMQSQHIIDYVVYNIFDSVSMQLLDEKTKDLRYTFPTFAQASDFAEFKSQPKKIANALFYYLYPKGKILGCARRVKDVTPEEMDLAEEHLDEVLDRKNWIVTLPAPMIVENGLCCIEENPALHTNIRLYAYDQDITSSYPSCILACNVSKETTVREIISIEGIDEMLFRHQNINALSGPVNAIEYSTTMFGLLKPFEMLAWYQQHRTNETT